MTELECVKVGMNCLAPTEDSALFMSARLPLPNDRVYAVVGALGTRTGNATYVGLGLNASVNQLGFDNISDETLAGSADGYDLPNHGQFFIQYFARDCTGLQALTAGSYCYSIGDKLPACYNPADLTCSMLVLSVRNYILPGTQRGPAAESTLSPRVIATVSDIACETRSARCAPKPSPRNAATHSSALISAKRASSRRPSDAASSDAAPSSPGMRSSSAADPGAPPRKNQPSLA